MTLANSVVFYTFAVLASQVNIFLQLTRKRYGPLPGVLVAQTWHKALEVIVKCCHFCLWNTL